jgi:hypothetical protein
MNRIASSAQPQAFSDFLNETREHQGILLPKKARAKLSSALESESGEGIGGAGKERGTRLPIDRVMFSTMILWDPKKISVRNKISGGEITTSKSFSCEEEGFSRCDTH